MTFHRSEFRLKVSRFAAICQFELQWGQNQCLTARLNYPASLEQLYQGWQQAYLNFYQQHFPEPPTSSAPDAMRARAVGSGGVQPRIDWAERLDDAEHELRHAFRNWLWQGELHDIRQAIAAASHRLEAAHEKLRFCSPAIQLIWCGCLGKLGKSLMI